MSKPYRPPYRHNASHQEIRESAPYLWGDHMSDECEDRSKHQRATYIPGSGPREQDDPIDDLDLRGNIFEYEGEEDA